MLEATAEKFYSRFHNLEGTYFMFRVYRDTKDKGWQTLYVSCFDVEIGDVICNDQLVDKSAFNPAEPKYIKVTNKTRLPDITKFKIDQVPCQKPAGVDGP